MRFDIFENQDDVLIQLVIYFIRNVVFDSTFSVYISEIGNNNWASANYILWARKFIIDPNNSNLFIISYISVEKGQRSGLREKNKLNAKYKYVSTFLFTMYFAGTWVTIQLLGILDMTWGSRREILRAFEAWRETAVGVGRIIRRQGPSLFGV